MVVGDDDVSVGLIGHHKRSSLAGVLTVGEAVPVPGQEPTGNLFTFHSILL